MNAHDVEPLAAEFRQLWDFARQATTPEQQHQGAIRLKEWFGISDDRDPQHS